MTDSLTEMIRLNLLQAVIATAKENHAGVSMVLRDAAVIAEYQKTIRDVGNLFLTRTDCFFNVGPKIGDGSIHLLDWTDLTVMYIKYVYLVDLTEDEQAVWRRRNNYSNAVYHVVSTR